MSRYNTVQPGPRYNVQTGSYGNLTANQLKNIALPDKLRCKRCQKWKSSAGDKENFSKKQLAEVRSEIYYSGRGKQDHIQIVCVSCNGQQVNELHCVMCDTTKGLECFAKAQRRNPVAAKCLGCMNEQLEFDPDLELNRLAVQKAKDYFDNSNSDSDSDGPNYSFGDDDKEDTASEMYSASIADDTTDYETSSGVTSSYVASRSLSSSMNTMNISGSSTGGVQLSQAESSHPGWQTATGVRTRARKAPASNAGVNGSISSSANTAPRPVIPSNKSNFAKVRAFKPPKDEPTHPLASPVATSTKAVSEAEELSITDPAWGSDSESSAAVTEVPEEEEEIVWDTDSDDE